MYSFIYLFQKKMKDSQIKHESASTSVSLLCSYYWGSTGSRKQIQPFIVGQEPNDCGSHCCLPGSILTVTVQIQVSHWDTLCDKGSRSSASLHVHLNITGLNNVYKTSWKLSKVEKGLFRVDFHDLALCFTDYFCCEVSNNKTDCFLCLWSSQNSDCRSLS